MFIHPQTVAMLCSRSCKKIIAIKNLPFAGTTYDLTLLGFSRNYSSIIQNDTSFNPSTCEQRILAPVFACRNIGDTRNLHSSTSTVTSNKNKVVEFIKKIFKTSKYGTTILSRSGYSLYEDISHNTDVLHFFKVLSLEDTLFSWFLVMELQVWLVAARLGAEKEDGKVVRDSLINAFWQDNHAKIKELGARPTNKSGQIEELNSHFQTSLVGYDEGLLSCDRTLACAVWRNIIRRDTRDPYYEGNEESSDDVNESSSKSSVDESKVNLDDLIRKPTADPRVLEVLVCYIRKQMYLLDQVPSEDLLTNGKVTWTKLEDIS